MKFSHNNILTNSWFNSQEYQQNAHNYYFHSKITRKLKKSEYNKRKKDWKIKAIQIEKTQSQHTSTYIEFLAKTKIITSSKALKCFFLPVFPYWYRVIVLYTTISVYNI